LPRVLRTLAATWPRARRSATGPQRARIGAHHDRSGRHPHHCPAARALTVTPTSETGSSKAQLRLRSKATTVLLKARSSSSASRGTDTVKGQGPGDLAYSGIVVLRFTDSDRLLLAFASGAWACVTGTALGDRDRRSSTAP